MNDYIITYVSDKIRWKQSMRGTRNLIKYFIINLLVNGSEWKSVQSQWKWVKCMWKVNHSKMSENHQKSSEKIYVNQDKKYLKIHSSNSVVSQWSSLYVRVKLIQIWVKKDVKIHCVSFSQYCFRFAGLVLVRSNCGMMATQMVLKLGDTSVTSAILLWYVLDFNLTQSPFTIIKNRTLSLRSDKASSMGMWVILWECMSERPM